LLADPWFFFHTFSRFPPWLAPPSAKKPPVPEFIFKSPPLPHFYAAVRSRSLSADNIVWIRFMICSVA
jgi:hypothetical protein